MEKINTETLVSSLFVIGFDKVDALLYTYTLGQLSLDNQKLQLFKFEDSSMSQKFNDYVDYDGITFKLKEGLTLKTNISPLENYNITWEKALHTNEKLIEYYKRQNLTFEYSVDKLKFDECRELIDEYLYAGCSLEIPIVLSNKGE